MLIARKQRSHAGLLRLKDAVPIDAHRVRRLAGYKCEVLPLPDNRNRWRVTQPAAGIDLPKLPTHSGIEIRPLNVDAVCRVIGAAAQDGLLGEGRGALPE